MIELPSKTLTKAIISSFKEINKDVELAKIEQQNDTTYVCFPDGDKYFIHIDKCQDDDEQP